MLSGNRGRLLLLAGVALLLAALVLKSIYYETLAVTVVLAVAGVAAAAAGAWRTASNLPGWSAGAASRSLSTRSDSSAYSFCSHGSRRNIRCATT